jgi:DNA-binding NtrC family response regulator
LAKERTHPIPVIITSRTGGWDEFLKALRQGAFDYLALPPQLEEVKRVLALAHQEAINSRGGTKAPTALSATLGRLHHTSMAPFSSSFSMIAPAFQRPPGTKFFRA